MRRLVTILFIILFLLIAVWQIRFFYSPVQVDNTVIRINKGENASNIINKLYQNKLIKSKFHAKLFLKITEKDKNLQSGSYHFSGNLNLIDVLDQIFSYQAILKKITIPEGLIIEDVCKRFSDLEMGDYEIFRELCYNYSFIKEITGMDISSLEGFLYPETYHFAEGVSEKEIIQTVVNELTKRLVSTGVTDSLYHNLNIYKLITLASIVEKEHRHKDEKSKIAGVYLNRLQIDHKLDADPTIVYILKKMGKIRKKVYYKDLKIESPYNTYIHNGLPPTPICSPTIDTILSTINAESTDYLYFFAKPDGYHEFSKSYREHLKKQSSGN
ncbi:MAG: endolytic transglycosylase MltG [Candidatus Cloacimonetes bacterium]|nr:endolytic transglycosylase MltG [Candidatus Cloacimonadota bacterium]